MENKNRIAPSALRRFPTIFLRTFFRLIYNEFAWAYDWVSSIVSLGQWKKWVFSTLPYIDGPRVLEIGFGPGHLQVALQHKNLWTVGIDVSRQMSHLALNRLARDKFLPQLIRGNATTLPFQNASFNQVVLTFPAEFILNDTTFFEIHRVLTQDGEVIILPMAWITGRNLLERFAAWLSRITGEAPEWDEKYLQSFRRLGFNAQWEIIAFNTSKALLLQMKKTPLQE